MVRPPRDQTGVTSKRSYTWLLVTVKLPDVICTGCESVPWASITWTWFQSVRSEVKRRRRASGAHLSQMASGEIHASTSSCQMVRTSPVSGDAIRISRAVWSSDSQLIATVLPSGDQCARLPPRREYRSPSGGPSHVVSPPAAGMTPSLTRP